MIAVPLVVRKVIHKNSGTRREGKKQRSDELSIVLQLIERTLVTDHEIGQGNFLNSWNLRLLPAKNQFRIDIVAIGRSAHPYIQGRIYNNNIIEPPLRSGLVDQGSLARDNASA